MSERARKLPMSLAAGIEDAESGGINSINHVGMVVRDLTAAATAWERLGFELTPLSTHSGTTTAGKKVQHLGTGNRCAVFANSYFELLALVDASLPDLGVEEALARFEGAHSMCFGCDDAVLVADRMSAADIATSGVLALQRDVETADGMRLAKFERVVLDEGEASEGMVQAARHLTPELIHQERYIDHPNGALDITEVIIVSPDPRVRAETYAKYVGATAIASTDKWYIDLGGSRITVGDAAQIGDLIGETNIPAVPAFAAVRLLTTDLDAAVAGWRADGVPHRQLGADIIIDREHATGVALIFSQAG